MAEKYGRLKLMGEFAKGKSWKESGVF